MSFRVGQKVVCVRDGWDNFPEGFALGSPLPKAGVEYIVRSIHWDDQNNTDVIRLLWMHYAPMAGGYEPAFGVLGRDGIANFKPVIETDIRIFTNMLKTKRRELVSTR